MPTYQGLRFKYADVLKEMRAITSLSQDFLSGDSNWVLKECRDNLESVKYGACDKAHGWEIHERTPLRTRPSDGEYRASAKGGNEAVFGELSFTWQIMNPDRGVQKQSHFILNGRASTSIKIFKCETEEIIARWQFEAGDAASPGCHFHSAVNQYDEERVFPRWLEIPRFPGLLVTPMDGLEFLMGELFQCDWLEHVSKDSADRNSWSNSQAERLKRVVEWQLDRVTTFDTTPWMSLKKAKPGIDLLTEA